MDERWDYIVVGGGSAGSTLAARLSEDSDVNVLLLEAGRDFRSAETPWQFRGRDTSKAMPPDPSDHEQSEFGTYFWPGIVARRNPLQDIGPYARGKGLGGCSMVNGLIALRPAPEDFALWVDMGAEGWSWDDVLPSLIRLETDEDFPEETYHGSNGPIPVCRAPESGWGGTDRALHQAAISAGYGSTDDVNAPDATGAGVFPLNIRNGERVSTNDGYLETARDRQNLTIRGGALVADVVTDSRTRRATGVRLVDGETISVHGGGEILLAAGAIHSPAILMRSGIGPHDDLRTIGIPTVQDLPVGRGAQDHAMIHVEYEADEAARTSVGGRHANAIVRYSSGIGAYGRNDMMFVANNHFATAGRPTRAGITVQLNAVDSRGTLSLRSSDPTVDPFLDLDMLESGTDLERMMDGIDRARALASQAEFHDIVKSELIYPRDADEARRAVLDIWHICSTARMGSGDAAETVVTPDCKVLGVEGLRVIDASVMPTVVRANIHLGVLAIAEKMSAELRAGRRSV